MDLRSGLEGTFKFIHPLQKPVLRGHFQEAWIMTGAFS